MLNLIYDPIFIYIRAQKKNNLKHRKSMFCFHINPILPTIMFVCDGNRFEIWTPTI